VTVEPDSELSESQNKALADRLREELARRHMSRQGLADAAKISISTLEKALNGSRPFTVASLVRLEQALGLTLRPKFEAHPAKADLGGYARSGVTWLEGQYLTIRPSFDVDGSVYAYRTDITWDDKLGCLCFREAERLDAPFAQKGLVSLPAKSGHIYLYTNEDGQMRLAIFGRPQITGELYGVLTTLAAGTGSNLTPICAPIALLPWAKLETTNLGRISTSDSNHKQYRKHLDSVVQTGFARILL
jgi:transcriptional regulator with XRE-family HTH domain